MSKVRSCQARERRASRKMRRGRVRQKIRGTAERPRLCVFRSLRYTYAQLISDESGEVLSSASTSQIEAEGVSRSSKESAKSLGQRMAELAAAKGIKEIVFDRNGYLYHGRVAAVAEGAREGGLKF